MGIYDNFNTTIPDLVSGANLNNAAENYANAFNKMFGTGTGGPLDWFNTQQGIIKGINDKWYNANVSSLTPNQLREMERQGINPYTDLPGMYGMGNGVLMNMDKAYETASNAGTALKTANDNWMNTQLNNMTDIQKADVVKRLQDGEDFATALKNTIAPDIKFYDDSAWRKAADPVYKSGYNILKDEVFKQNQNKGTTLERWSKGQYDIPEDIQNSNIRSQLNTDLKTTDQNRLVAEAAQKIATYMKAKGVGDWEVAADALNIDPKLREHLSMDKITDIYNTATQEGMRAAATFDSNVEKTLNSDSADIADSLAKKQESINKRLALQYNGDKDQMARKAKDEFRYHARELMSKGINEDTFNQLDDLIEEYSSVATRQDLEKELIEHSGFSRNLSKFMDNTLEKELNAYPEIFSVDPKTGKFDIEKATKNNARIIQNINGTLQRLNIPEYLRPKLIEQVTGTLKNRIEQMTFGNGKTDHANYMAALFAAQSLGAITDSSATKSVIESINKGDTFSGTAAAGVDLKEGPYGKDLMTKIGGAWNSNKLNSDPMFDTLSPSAKGYVVFKILNTLSSDVKKDPNKLLKAVEEKLSNSAQITKLYTTAKALSDLEKARQSLSLQSVAPK